MPVRRIPFLLFLFFTITACSEDPLAPDPAKIEAIGGFGQTAEVGTKLAAPLSIRVVDAKGFPVRDVPVTWTATAANGSLTVTDALTDRTGISRADWVIGNKIGTHTVGAEVAGLPPVTFLANGTPGAPAAIAFNRDSLVARDLGDTLRITAAVADRFGNPLTDQTVTYTSSNEAIASVSTAGLITTRGRGNATITARRGNASTNFRVRVVEVARIVISPSPLVFSALEQTRQLSARVEDAEGIPFTKVTVSWNATNATVLSVSSTGVVRAVGNGSAQVIATTDGVFGSVIGSVAQVVTRLSISPGTPVIGVGASLQLTATARDAGGFPVANQPIIWSTDNTAVAGITLDGMITGTSRGDTNVKAQTGSVSAVSPVVVSTILTQIAAGDAHSCAIGRIGPLQPSAPMCWGFPLQGRLGHGSDDTGGLAAEDVRGNLSLVRIGAGGAHSCGLTATGAGWCWGYNGLGQLGSGGLTDSNVPVPVTGGDAFLQLSTGQAHTCAVTNANRALCWGSNIFGQLGIGGSAGPCSGATCLQTPGEISGGLSIRWVAAGSRHSCGIVSTSGTAYCWGSNSNGQLGTGNTVASNAPVIVSTAVTFVELAAGDDFTCGISTDGRAFCWGRNAAGQLGIGSTADQTTPVPIASTLTFTGIVAGGSHACARTDSGQIWCWGANFAGQLGNGTTTESRIPVQVQMPDVIFATFSTGREHSCAVTSAGQGYCWGRNTSAQLGDGTTLTKSLPSRVR